MADPEMIYQNQLAQSTVCTKTHSLGGATTMDSVDLGNSFSASGGTQSLGNNSAIGSEEQKVLFSRHPLRSQSKSGLPAIDEVESPDKTKVHVGNQTEVDVGEKTTVGIGEKTTVDIGEETTVDIGEKTTVDIGDVGVTAIAIEATEVDVVEPSMNEMQLEEHIKKLKEEAAEFERLRKLREEAAVLERLRDLREEAIELEFKSEATKRSEGTRAVTKVPPPPLLPTIDAEYPTKRKTRSEIAAEAKEAEEAKKRNKRTKKNRRG